MAGFVLRIFRPNLFAISQAGTINCQTSGCIWYQDSVKTCTWERDGPVFLRKVGEQAKVLKTWNGFLRDTKNKDTYQGKSQANVSSFF